MNIFWDLDGTLIDPFLGITDAVQFALEKSGITPPPSEDLKWVIGPALIESFTKLGVPDPDAALALYRAHYTGGGMFRAKVYDGIPEALGQLKAAGHRMFLMTAKPHAYAGKITEHFGLAQFMEVEFGPELDGTRNDKAELLAYAIQKLGVAGQPGVMIGDRQYDFIAARENAMTSIGVNWGYGPEAELAPADHLCQKPADFPALVSDIAATLAAG